MGNSSWRLTAVYWSLFGHVARLLAVPGSSVLCQPPAASLHHHLQLSAPDWHSGRRTEAQPACCELGNSHSRRPPWDQTEVGTFLETVLIVGGFSFPQLFFPLPRAISLINLLHTDPYFRGYCWRTRPRMLEDKFRFPYLTGHSSPLPCFCDPSASVNLKSLFDPKAPVELCSSTGPSGQPLSPWCLWSFLL